MSITVPTGSEQIRIDLWRSRVGRAHLLLLDGYGGPSPEDRYAFCRRLYGGDLRTRLMQEIILGIGGYRGLRAMAINPGVIHMNEGHSGFAALEAIATCIEEEGCSFDLAAQKVKMRTVFTTHTPVAAGHDRFPGEMVEEHLKHLRERLHLSRKDFLALGRVNPNDDHEPFCMTVLALKLANRSNGVSTLHGGLSRSMWKDLWPQRPVSQIPIGHITNGVHVPSWVALEMGQFLKKHLGRDWLRKLSYESLWPILESVDPFEVWDIKCSMKKRLLRFVHRNILNRSIRLGESGANIKLNPDALTIGFARRFVEYKRHTLLFRDLDRLAKLINKADRPVQMLIAGKAHPKDDIGKGILRQVYEFTQDERFRGKIILLENYDMNMGRHLVQGCDLWMNTPRRPMEACGTSGQKAVFNGTLNFSTLDGWWAEAYDRRNGYSIGNGLIHSNKDIQDQRDAQDLMNTLEHEIIPDYFDRTSEGVPTRWVEKILHALATLAPRYNSDRMVMDYTRHCYLSCSGSLTSEFLAEV